VSPQLYIIAGPNGSGKTTFASRFLPLFTQSNEFVNADVIAQRLSPKHPEAAAIRAGREMLERIETLASQKIDFAIETTLSGKAYIPWLTDLKSHGYEIQLFFLWLPDVQLSLKRVADRVKHGGHNIPESVIRRRYAAGISNLFLRYRPLADTWSLFDNSRELPYLIAKESQHKLTVLDEELFEICSSMANKPTDDLLGETAKAPDWLPALHALRMAKADVIEQHIQSGHPIIIWRNGEIYQQPPEEAKRELEDALKNNFWTKSGQK